ncbi:hypothetical protein ACIO93_42265 [Streptomyces sp. NPDC087903]|uniref:hypothetical protein n=1 Tax=Streptomyces sp. NPDC087903 TaxID=3365819 RepID=UPI003808C2B7
MSSGRRILLADYLDRGWTGNDAAAAATDPLSLEIPHSREGAQSAAARIAAALGSEAMFSEQDRHNVVQLVVEPAKRGELQAAFDADYSPDLNRRIGLDAEGHAPAGATFVSRSMPAGVTLHSYSPAEATVAVWCSGFFGLTGKGVTEIPVKTSWFTMTLTVHWTTDGWRVTEFTQQDGPEPAAGNFGAAPQP